MKMKKKKSEICAQRENAGRGGGGGGGGGWRRQAVSVMLARSLSSRLPTGQSFLSASQFFVLFLFLIVVYK